MFTQALNNEHMVWNGRLLTPMEVGYLAQKFYVGVHPFAEGNGRLINNMIQCIDQYKKNNPAEIDYNCRILK